MAWILFLPMVAAAAGQSAPADDVRSRLQEVVSYARLQAGGAGLAQQAYALLEADFVASGHASLAAASVFFQGLAALEMDDIDLARSLFARCDWPGDSQWAQLSRAYRARCARRWAADQPTPLAERRLRAALTPGWSDEQTDLPDEPTDLLHAAAAWARTMQLAPLQKAAPAIAATPSLSLIQDGAVAVSIEFWDPALFRVQFVARAAALQQRLNGDTEPDSLLASLWCSLLLRQGDAAAKTLDTLTDAASRRELTRDQIQELQCLAAALAAQQGQSEEVEKFLMQRLEKPPKSSWALRAVNIVQADPQLRLRVLQAAAATAGGGSHPFSASLLAAEPDRVERLLDGYWEVAWGHRNCAVQRSGWRVAEPGREPDIAAVRAVSLASELASPNVLESWRPFSLLRLEAMMETGALVGDTESWQVRIGDQHQQHALLDVAVSLSRHISGSLRTRRVDGEIASLTDVQAENVAVLLVGAGQATELTVAPAPEPRGSSIGRWVGLSLAAIVAVVATGIAVWLRSYVRGRP